MCRIGLLECNVSAVWRLLAAAHKSNASSSAFTRALDRQVYCEL